jgi:hypothetical protein
MLHQLLIKSPEAALDFLNEQDRKNTTNLEYNESLQLSAKNGNVEIVLRLLFEHKASIDFYEYQPYNKDKFDSQSLGDKTPLYIALEYEQFFIAQILIACGASVEETKRLIDKNNNKIVEERLNAFKISPEITIGILFWMISYLEKKDLLEVSKDLIKKIPQINKPTSTFNNHQALLSDFNVVININENFSEHKSVFSYPQYLSGLVPFAASRKHFEFAQKLYLFNTDTSSVSESSLTYSYWASIAREESHLFLGKNKSNDTYIITTLNQLNHSNDAFQFLYDQLSAKQQKKFDDSLTLEANEKKQEKLPKLAKKIRHAARFNHQALLSKYAKHIKLQDMLPYVLDIIVKEQDFVAFVALCKTFKVKDIFSYCLDKKNKSLFIITMFITNHYFYQLIALFPQKQSEISQLVEIDSHASLVHNMVSRALAFKAKDIRSENEIAIQHDYFKETLINESYFQKIYVKHAGIGIATVDRSVIFESVGRFGFNSSRYWTIISKIDNLVLLKDIKSSSHIKSHAFLKGPLPVLKGFLSARDKGSLAVTCSGFSCVGAKFVNKIDLFLKQLESKIQRQSYFAYIDYGLNSPTAKRKLLIGVISLLALAPSIYLNIKRSTLGHKGIVEEGLRANGCISPDSDDEYSYRHCPTFNTTDICQALCIDYLDFKPKLRNAAAFLLSLTSAVGLFFVMPTILQIKQSLSEGKITRCGELSLKVFAPELNADARILFATIPGDTLTMDSSVQSIIQILKQEKLRLKKNQEKKATPGKEKEKMVTDQKHFRIALP